MLKKKRRRKRKKVELSHLHMDITSVKDYLERGLDPVQNPIIF